MPDKIIMEKVKYLKVTNIFVEITWYLSWLAMALMVALIIATTVFDFQVKYIQIPVEITFPDISDNSLNDSNSLLPVVGFFNPRVDTDNIDYQNMFYLIPFLLLAGVLVIIFQVRKFLATVRKGSPFVKENPRRIKIIGLIVTFGTLFFGTANYIYASYYKSFLDIPGAEIDVIKGFDPILLLIGLVILVIAKVFEVGVTLQTDHDLTV